MYPSPDRENLASIRHIEHPDRQKFPLFEKAVPAKFNLEPGELLFVPSHWWHTVKILTPNVTLAANVLNQPNWHELVKFVVMRQHSPIVSLASGVYLAGAGAWRDWQWCQRVYQRAS